MGKSIRLLIWIPLSFTMLVGWFAWSALHSAPPLASENLRGAGLSISAAIEQLAAADPSFRSLARYSTPDITYFVLIDRNGVIRFHTNPGLVGQPLTDPDQRSFPEGISEQRELLGTGEEVYILRTKIHPDHDEYLLVLALHTYRADKVIRRARAGVTVVSSLTVVLWGLALFLIYMLRKEERHNREMNRREELARLGEMSAVMAHEIRNPLAGIKGFAQLVDTADDIEQARLYADRIVAQSLRMEALVNNLLAFSRGDNLSERQPTDIAALIKESALLINEEAKAKQVTVEVDITSNIKANVAPDRIVQILLNLAQNAVQAMPEGGLLKLALRKEKGTVVISVSDTGIGIPTENIPHIFEPFWTSKARGTGLGLALCHKVALEHGGNLTVESTEGVGTTFTLTLPSEGDQ